MSRKWLSYVEIAFYKQFFAKGTGLFVVVTLVDVPMNESAGQLFLIL